MRWGWTIHTRRDEVVAPSCSSGLEPLGAESDEGVTPHRDVGTGRVRTHRGQHVAGLDDGPVGHAAPLGVLRGVAELHDLVHAIDARGHRGVYQGSGVDHRTLVPPVGAHECAVEHTAVHDGGGDHGGRGGGGAGREPGGDAATQAQEAEGEQGHEGQEGQPQAAGLATGLPGRGVGGDDRRRGGRRGRGLAGGTLRSLGTGGAAGGHDQDVHGRRSDRGGHRGGGGGGAGARGGRAGGGDHLGLGGLGGGGHHRGGVHHLGLRLGGVGDHLGLDGLGGGFGDLLDHLGLSLGVGLGGGGGLGRGGLLHHLGLRLGGGDLFRGRGRLLVIFAREGLDGVELVPRGLLLILGLGLGVLLAAEELVFGRDGLGLGVRVGVGVGVGVGRGRGRLGGVLRGGGGLVAFRHHEGGVGGDGGVLVGHGGLLVDGGGLGHCISFATHTSARGLCFLIGKGRGRRPLGSLPAELCSSFDPIMYHKIVILSTPSLAFVAGFSGKVGVFG
ncbi:MAG: hypothetical protein UU40_C0008G0024 [Candidatus Uhrbacteria bacterium GW2011_GWD2_41_121]|nr:MAG: hypothetical protein UU04_C0007G0001 [Candidatus Uhrbacteria bacterium GW2011_GWC2_40_450]KKR90127.1 MAG: hypothetical protein UU40_C0008G0024 [Candidatus Uhrbacteria bacterium GW2011_GWD2_41_121]KKS51496.1 MAG: hypothetical protein UV15_C0008G0024 [Candidatus Uhrbacteria bacterium GW2011_GWA2_42_220]